MTAEQHLEQLRGQRILITGGTGFIGSHLVARLESGGIPCTAVVQRGPAPASLPQGCDWVELDLAHAEKVETLVTTLQPEIVFHVAGVVGGERSLEFARRAFTGNLVASHNLLVALGRCAQPRRIVLIGSSEEYGRQDALPYTEDMPARPVSPYSASKAAVTQFAVLYHALFGLPIVVLRPFVVYGPGQAAGMMIPSLMEALRRGQEFAMTPGEQTRDMVYVSDVVDCLLAASIEPAAVGEVFNVCTGEEHSVRELAEAVAALAGAGSDVLRIGALPYRSNEVWRLVGSNDKAGNLLGWQPRVRLEEGLHLTWDAYTI